jgi:hypothetical protein
MFDSAYIEGVKLSYEKNSRVEAKKGPRFQKSISSQIAIWKHCRAYTSSYEKYTPIPQYPEYSSYGMGRSLTAVWKYGKLS